VLVSMAVQKRECTCGMGVCGVCARAWARRCVQGASESVQAENVLSVCAVVVV
jgi:hypothetical protein